MQRPVWSVRDLTLYIKELLASNELLWGLWVRGEISNWKLYPSGHAYFTLKDEHAQVKCVMWRTYVQRLRFQPQNGMQVLAGGRVEVYERDGVYQLYVSEMEPAGLGALHQAFEQLKQKLAAEGLFDQGRKRPLPRLPRKVGIVTSPVGAAVRDMITVARRRWPGVHLLLAPAQVQGDEAPASLIAALELLQQVPEVDVIIIGRGGGSLEELWAFNDEALARAIARCRVPVVSAVGHETDFTIADFVADLRAPTPSAAAELVVPSRADLVAAIDGARQRLVLAVRQHIGRRRQQVAALASRPVLRRPLDRILAHRQRLDDLTRRLGLAAGARIRDGRARLAAAAARLDALSPLACLARGYAIALDAQGRALRDAAAVRPGDRVQVVLHRGRLLARVEATYPLAGGGAGQGE